jgi:hypothetical protein
MKEQKPPPERGSRWINPVVAHGVIKVLGVVDGWVVWRYKGAMPGLCHKNNWSFLPAPPLPAKKRGRPGEGE